MALDDCKQNLIGIDINTLYLHHEELMSNNMTSECHANNIVHVLGGIDNILKGYISMTRENVNNLSLNDAQIQQIYQILSDNNNKIKKENITENTTKSDVIYYFDPINNFLHSLCRHKIANIIEYMYNRYIVASLMISSAIWYGLNVFLPILNTVQIYFVLEMVYAAILCIYMLLVVLSVNKTAFYGTLKTFDFYIKTYYIMAATIALNIYWESIQEHQHQKLIDNIQRTVMVLLIITFSIVDGLNRSWITLFILGIFASTAATTQAFMYLFIYHSTHPEKQIIVYGNISISLLSYISGCYRVLTVFLWKQTIKLYLTKGKSCVTIKISPKKKWKHTDNALMSIKPSVQQSTAPVQI